MKRFFLILFMSVLGLILSQAVLAEDCVEVDIELPATVVAEAGGFATGYFELTNCGDDAGYIWLEFDIDLNGVQFPIGQIPVYLGAAETISREFYFPVPPLAMGYTVTFCVTATSGEYVADDCATMTVESSDGGESIIGKTTGLNFTSENGECVDVDLELPDTVYAASNSFMEGYFEIINCGDEAATVMMSVSLDLVMFDTTITLGDIPIEMGAGDEISREFRLPIPPVVPEGTFGICITAVSGESMASACQAVEVVSEWGPPESSSPEFNLQNYPNPFNPTTAISFELSQQANVSLEVYNILGQQVSQLVNGELQPGVHIYEWDSGKIEGLSSGIYFYRLQVDDKSVSNKMTVLK
ncbi:MAG: hypothetical protein DRP46_13595 [Candidatus Zixiibacteriota bacterium]|nr:MAG: hypothetical protein DRP46_13595 [candidate division Zixibacteria bacterium]